MDPKVISEWVSERGIMENLLHGYSVYPGDSPIDKFLVYLSDNLIEWNPSESIFQDAARMFLGRVPTIGNEEYWINLIRSSSQNENLKEMLIDLTEEEYEDVMIYRKQYRITMKRGTEIICHEIKKVPGKKGGIYLLVGIGPTYDGNFTGVTGRKKSRNPEFFERVPAMIADPEGYKKYRWRFEKILTMNPENVATIESV